MLKKKYLKKSEKNLLIYRTFLTRSTFVTNKASVALTRRPRNNGLTLNL
jgi:hypothetical protein